MIAKTLRRGLIAAAAFGAIAAAAYLVWPRGLNAVEQRLIGRWQLVTGGNRGHVLHLTPDQKLPVGQSWEASGDTIKFNGIPEEMSTAKILELSETTLTLQSPRGTVTFTRLPD